MRRDGQRLASGDAEGAQGASVDVQAGDPDDQEPAADPAVDRDHEDRGRFLVAIGLEGIVTGQYLFTLVFVPLGVFVSMLPIRIKTGVCIACRSPLEQSQAICPKCGAPQM